MLVGIGANRIGWLPAEAGRYLGRIVVNIAAPCVVVGTMSSQGLADGGVHGVLLLLGAGAAQVAVMVALSFPLARALRPPSEDRGVYRNFLVFTNNGFMGFPVALAIFGETGMFYMVIANCMTNVFVFTFGIWNVKKRSKDERGVTREMLKELMNPLTISLCVGLFLLLNGVSLPDPVMDVLDSVGAMMAPLSMMVIGLQLTESKLGGVLSNRRLIAMTVIRLVALGVLFFLLLLPLYLNGVVPALFAGVLTLNALLPCATVPVMFAEEFGGNAKLAAEGTFLSTLFSIATIPVAGALLSSFFV
jgi:predicted permease